jgi:transposase
VADNYGTHKTPAVKAWLARHPRFHLHFTPTGSSWLNQVERWFAFLTDQKIRRGVHRSVQALKQDIRDWVKTWNEDPNRSCGRRPPRRSSTAWPAICNESPARTHETNL